MSQAKLQGELAKACIDEFPNYPSKTIARILAERDPLVFPDIETARARVRYYRGAKGNLMRSRLSDKSRVRPSGTVSDSACPMPAPIEQVNPWAAERIGFKCALGLYDTHIPYHDAKAVSVAIEHGVKRGVDCIIIGGDLADFYAVSAWERDPRKRCLGDEIESCKLFIEHLRSKFPKAQIVYQEGNHEERLWRYVWTRCPELATVRDGSGKEMLGLASVLDLDEYGIKLVDGKRPILAGEHLYLLHGHEFRAMFNNPVNPARGLYLRAKTNAVCGHLHQTSNHTETGLEKVVSCWSVGCLCDLHPHYMPLNKWNHGFCLIELNKDAWRFENLKIINGNVV